MHTILSARQTIASILLIYLLSVPDCLDNQFREENIVKESVSYFVQRRNRILRCRIGVAAHQLLMKIH